MSLKHEVMSSDVYDLRNTMMNTKQIIKAEFET